MPIQLKTMEMIIKKNVLNYMTDEFNAVQYETGCILGKNNNVIDTVVFDKFAKSDKYRYQPDVVFLNGVIDEWYKNGTEFCGFAHSHFFNIRSLSEEDIFYIRLITDSVYGLIDELYFPIISLPEKVVTVYRAKKKSGEINIVYDKIRVTE